MIRATKIELFKFSPERRDQWRHLSEQIQRMQNRMWQTWLIWHVENGSESLIKTHLDAYKDWSAKEPKSRGKKPKWPVQACSNELSNRIYHSISSEFQDVHSRTRVLLQNKWKHSLDHRKSSSGKLPGWVAILFANESIPSCTRPQPIPFDKKSCPRDIAIKKDGSKYIFTVRIERLANGDSVTESAEMMMNRKRMQSQRRIIDRIIDGEYTFKGSSIVYSRGKWFASLSYEMPKADIIPLDKNYTLEVIPGKKTPWIVKVGDDAWKYGGRGRPVTRKRQMIQNERWSRQEHNRWAGSATKGRGASRAKSAWTKLSSRWKDFVKTYNNHATKRIIDICRERGIGKIVFHQPVDDKRDLMFLSNSGRHPQSRMTWDWFQVGTQLQHKAEEYGIEVVIERWAKHDRTDTSVQPVRTNNGSNGKSSKSKIKRAAKAVS